MGNAATLFNGTVAETLYGRITPTQEQRDFLKEQWNALADSVVVKLEEKHGYAVSTWLQGSYKFGTLIKPVHKGEEYDVDVGMYFEWGDDDDNSPTPELVRHWVQQALVDYAEGSSVEMHIAEPKERCSRAVFAKQFHIDTPVYHLRRDPELRELARLSGEWEQSDPKAIYLWFRNLVPQERRSQLRRQIRYLKAWAAVEFAGNQDARPPSVLLTVLGAEAYDSTLADRAEMPDDEALAAILNFIADRLERNPAVRNPVSTDEELNRLSANGCRKFVESVRAFQEVATRALEASDEAAAALVWSEAFSFLMPLPEADEVEVIDGQSGEAVMQLPAIDIAVYSRNPRVLRDRYQNEVPSVAKDCDLVFTIANPHVVPQFATIEWTVRNVGLDAETIGDLGHRRSGIGLFSVNEGTQYAGRQFMDCVVRLNGQVYAVRRVPVTIRGYAYPARNPPRPSYVKLKSRLARRGR